jgi:CBS-domain-containing membrane protein
MMETDIPTVSARARLETAVKALTELGKPVVGVVDGSGRLIGMLTAENLGEMLLVQSATPQRPGPWRRPAGA